MGMATWNNSWVMREAQQYTCHLGMISTTHLWRFGDGLLMGSPHYRALEVTCIQSQLWRVQNHHMIFMNNWYNQQKFWIFPEMRDLRLLALFWGQISVEWPFISSWGDGELTLPELLDGAAKSREFQNRLRVMDIDQATWADCEQNISQNKMSTYVNPGWD